MRRGPRAGGGAAAGVAEDAPDADAHAADDRGGDVPGGDARCHLLCLPRVHQDAVWWWAVGVEASLPRLEQADTGLSWKSEVLL